MKEFVEVDDDTKANMMTSFFWFSSIYRFSNKSFFSHGEIHVDSPCGEWNFHRIGYVLILSTNDPSSICFHFYFILCIQSNCRVRHIFSSSTYCVGFFPSNSCAHVNKTPLKFLLSFSAPSYKNKKIFTLKLFK